MVPMSSDPKYKNVDTPLDGDVIAIFSLLEILVLHIIQPLQVIEA